FRLFDAPVMEVDDRAPRPLVGFVVNLLPVHCRKQYFAVSRIDELKSVDFIVVEQKPIAEKIDSLKHRLHALGERKGRRSNDLGLEERIDRFNFCSIEPSLTAPEPLVKSKQRYN